MSATIIEFRDIFWGLVKFPWIRIVSDNQQVVVHHSRGDVAVYSTEDVTTVWKKGVRQAKWDRQQTVGYVSFFDRVLVSHRRPVRTKGV